MFNSSSFFFSLALIAAILAFGGFLAGVVVAIAKLLFFMFLVLWLMAYLTSVPRRARVEPLGRGEDFRSGLPG